MPERGDLGGLERLTDAVKAEYLEHYAILPLELRAGTLVLATWIEEPDVQALDDLCLLFGADLVLRRLPEDDVRSAIRRVYGDDAVTAEELIAGLEPAEEVFLEEMPLDDLLSMANEAPVVKLVNFLLLEALQAGASDVHIEAYAESLRTRYRVDGVLQDAPTVPPQLIPAVISRLKIMAELDVAERRVPQDGRIRLRLQDRQVDVRMSTLPTLHGESVVLRLLDKEQGRVDLDHLGMADDTLILFSEAIAKPHGIVLVTGPTGCGKTTTLYAAVERIRTGREKILTVEDPVEYELAGVPQVPVREKVGVTFATALRSLLRQDPDVLLVGEIRDEETADVATHAALTGHLVLSTLHTNDAPTAITRLLDLGVPSYLVSSTVEAVLAQRLVRTTCAECRYEAGPPPTIAALGKACADLEAELRGRGCPACRGTGFRGRTGIFELLVMSDALGEEVRLERGTAALRRLAVAEGMRTLIEDAARHVRNGLATTEEVLRVTRV